VSFSLRDESVPDACPLTSAEKTLKAELEAVVRSGLDEFLRVGNALATLRNKRLFRTEFGTFEEYCRNKFGLARSSADSLIRRCTFLSRAKAVFAARNPRCLLKRAKASFVVADHCLADVVTYPDTGKWFIIPPHKSFILTETSYFEPGD